MGKKVDLNTRKHNNNHIRKNNHNYYNYNNSRNLSPENAEELNEINQNTNALGTSSFQREYEPPKSANLTIKMPLPVKVALTAGLIGIPLFLLMVFVVIFASDDSSGGLAFGGYYELPCNEITVIDVDALGNPTESKTYDLEDYVAGVVYAEIGEFDNLEVYKTYAVAARTYVSKVASNECTIENSTRAQTFKDITNLNTNTSKMIYEAVEATKGQVVLSDDGNLLITEYDAFCFIEKTADYYTLAQQGQQIPVEWANNNINNRGYLNCQCEQPDKNIKECYNTNGEWLDGGHGRGMSQYGALYLAEEQEYTYDKILKFYYGDEIIVSSQYMTSIAGLSIKNTTDAKALDTRLDEFLNSNGSSIENMNTFIHDSVISVGAGTREGVVVAAVSLINYLYDNFNTKLPYYWGGAYQHIGVSPSFGSYSPSTPSRSGKIYYYQSFDCSGFVSWSIKNGGYNFNRTTSFYFDVNYSDDSCDIESSSCVGQPGDLINSPNDHVELIVAVDLENEKYVIAHSGTEGVVMKERPMHVDTSSKKQSKILHMDSFYNNPEKVNTSY